MKLGFVVKDLWLSQMAFYLTMNLNQRNQVPEVDDVVIFFEDVAQYSVSPLFATMNSSEIWGFDGILISTCISTTLNSVGAIGPQERYFYAWDLDWLRDNKNYDYNIKAFDPSINIIGRSEDHGKAIENYCNRKPCGYVQNFNLAQLVEVIKNEQSSTRKE